MLDVKKVRGPYVRKDQREYVELVFQDGQRLTCLTSRWLMMQHLGRRLETWEHVHHVDENPFNDVIENLEVVDIREHARFHRWVERVVVPCTNCSEPMLMRPAALQPRYGKSHFCGNSCRSVYYDSIQFTRK